MTSASRRTVLVVDDDDDMRALQATFLRRCGHDVVLAADAREALRLLAGGLRPGVILLDFHLPDMDARALRAAQRERALALDVPVILYSADPDVSGDGIDAVAVLVYPIDLNDLGVLVDAVCARS
ncbi:response regulator [Candidatus Binatia bacterium]|nr:response regulator [Candidatus Binatia bacterium]